MATDQITLTARCLCKANIFTAQVEKSKLPLPAHACHCNSCRHATGAMYSIDAYWPEPTKNVDLSKLKEYHFTDKISIHFCRTCSTPMFFGRPKDPNADLGIFTGTVDNADENLFNIVDHIFVGDTVDGGATMWLRKPNLDGSEARRFKESKEGESKQELPFDWPSSSSLTGYERKLEDAIPIRCRCKGVHFVLNRGDYTGTAKEDLPWFIEPKTHKNIAGECACDSCRLFCGIDLMYWTFAELSHVSFPKAGAAAGKRFPAYTADLKNLVDAKDPAVGTLSYYASSAEVQRYFCSNCSACIFYAVDERAAAIDVAIGALEASDGARAEGFLCWRFGHVDFAEDTKGGWREGLVKQVKKESEQWRDERGYPKIGKHPKETKGWSE